MRRGEERNSEPSERKTQCCYKVIDRLNNRYMTELMIIAETALSQKERREREREEKEGERIKRDRRTREIG